MTWAEIKKAGFRSIGQGYFHVYGKGHYTLNPQVGYVFVPLTSRALQAALKDDLRKRL